jgi:UDP-glucose 4-epimerase
MRVLITGGAGFVGSNLTDRLLERGDEVVVIDTFATARRDSLDTTAKSLQIEELSVADREGVDRVFESFRPDCVVHAAASYKDPEAWGDDSRTNVLGTANVVRAAEAVDTRRLIYLQTALCYGLRPLEQPITLAHPLDPAASSYAISKTAGEYYVRLGGVDWISFRLANVYGPRNLSGPLPTFYQRLAAGKPCFVMDTRRDFVYVDDLVSVMLKAIDGEGDPGVYHVSSGADVSIKELFDATTAAMGIELESEVEVRPRTEDDAPTILLDPSTTEQTFGWKAQTSLEKGVRAAIEYYREFGVEETFTHLKPLDEADSPSRR